MYSYLRAALIGLFMVCTLPAEAQLVDQMLSVQAATTSVGKLSDKTTITRTHEQDIWSSRTFAVTSSEVCNAKNPTSIGIANGGTGVTNVEVVNAKGEIAITWEFGQGIPASSFPYSTFEVDLANTSSLPEIILGAVFTLSTNVTDITIGYPGIRVRSSGSSSQKTIPFKFRAAAPSLLEDRSTAIRSITLRFVPRSACDSTFAIQSVRLSPHSGNKNKSKSKARSAPSGTGGPDPVSTAVAVATAKPNPCEADPTVGDQIQECQDRHERSAAECATWKCDCQPSADGKSFHITSSTTTLDETIGKACTSFICGPGQGRCTEFAECIPSQFYGYDNEFIGASADGLVFRGGHNNPMEMSCFNVKQLPHGRQLCSMTIKQFEEAFLASMMPGAPCELGPRSMGVCDHTGLCVPDLTGDSFCKEKDNCTVCSPAGVSPKRICWNKKCSTEEDAAREICIAEVSQSSNQFCKPCVVTVARNSAGSCGTTMIRTNTPDRRSGIKVSMDTTRCLQRGLEGVCRAGGCDLSNAVPTPAPVAAGTPAK